MYTERESPPNPDIPNQFRTADKLLPTALAPGGIPSGAKSFGNAQLQSGIGPDLTRSRFIRGLHEKKSLIHENIQYFHVSDVLQ